MKPTPHIQDLLALMARLRDPEHGCAWDIKQTFASIAHCTVEEAYEVLDAIARGDMDDLQEELGDVLLQVVFHAHMASEQGMFNFGDVVEGLMTKLIRRHPHVFEKPTELGKPQTPQDVKGLWDKIKAQEKREKQEKQEKRENQTTDQSINAIDAIDELGFLDRVPAYLPPMQRAQKLTKRAAEVGFDWPDASDVIAKIHEELMECEQAHRDNDKDALQDEIGDLLFAVINFARHAKIDPELALSRTNHKFVSRFGFIEQNLKKQDKTLQDASLVEMESLWQQAKKQLV